MIITFRPDFVPPWVGRSHVTLLTLARLAQRQGASIIQGVTGGRPLPAEVQDQIVAKTDGVPLFIEELTKSMLESELLREAENRFVLTSPLPPVAIPTTLHDSLLARLDRLGPAKETAQIGAANITLELKPDFSARVFASKDPYKRQADLENLLIGLQKAAFPE